MQNRNEKDIELAIKLLRRARVLLSANRCKHATAKVRRAMKSAEGALRNARGHNVRTEQEARIA